MKTRRAHSIAIDPYDLVTFRRKMAEFGTTRLCARMKLWFSPAACAERRVAILTVLSTGFGQGLAQVDYVVR